MWVPRPAGGAVGATGPWEREGGGCREGQGGGWECWGAPWPLGRGVLGAPSARTAKAEMLPQNEGSG